MPYKIEWQNTGGLSAAPNVQISYDDLKFKLTDANGGVPLPIVVEFHVVCGGGYFLFSDSHGGVIPRNLVQLTSDASGIVSPLPFKMGPEEGLNIIRVQSPYASCEAILQGTYSGVQVALTKPDLQDRDNLSGVVLNVVALVTDSNYKNNPIPDLPMEVEVIAGAAVFPTIDGDFGHYDIRWTGADGSISFPLTLSRWKDDVKVRFVPYYQREIAPVELDITARSPALNAWGDSLQVEVPVNSVCPACRQDISDARTPTISPTDKRIDGLFVFAEEPNQKAILQPAAAPGFQETNSVLGWPTVADSFDLKLRMPDYPDTAKLEYPGIAAHPLEGTAVTTSQQGPVPGSPFLTYIESTSGGDTNQANFIRADIRDGGLQYQGPSVVSAKPVMLDVEVLAPQPNYRLVEARIKFKVRLTPYNSSIDDPTDPNSIAGLIGESAAGPWSDSLEHKMGDTPGITSLSIYFQSNAQNLDHLIDITASVTLESKDAQGNVTNTDYDTTLQLRAAFLRPRFSFSRLQNGKFVPITDGGIRPVAFMDATGTQQMPGDENAFYIEALSHDLGASLGCRLKAGSSVDVTLDPQPPVAGQNYTLYRSPPCYVSVDDYRNGGPKPAAPQNGYITVDAATDGSMEAFSQTKFPNNTANIIYTTGRRPVSTFAMIAVGSLGNRDRLARPNLQIDVAADATWSTSIQGTDVSVQLKGRVHDPIADLGGAVPATFEVNGTSYPLKPDLELTSSGRPVGWIGRIDQSIKVPLGVQLIVVSVKNSLGVIHERKFRLEVIEATNNRAAPAKVTANVHPLSAPFRSPVPFLYYLYAAGTNLGENVIPPPTFDATVTSLAAFPSTSGDPAVPISMGLRPAGATAYASKTYLPLRKDLLPTGTAAPNGALVLPPGGRLEWSTATLPNIDLSISLKNRREHRVQDTKLMHKTAAGGWEEAVSVVTGETYTVDAFVYPAASATGAEASIAFVDPVGGTVRGDGRVLLLELGTQIASGHFRVSQYSDLKTAPKNGSEIVILADSQDIPTDKIPVRVFGSGRVVAGINLSAITADVPAFIKPARGLRGGNPLDQEGLRHSVNRIGALESVVPGTGEFVHVEFDRHLPSRGLDVAVERTYRSANLFPGPLGFGWNPSWNVFLWEESDTEVHLLQGNGIIVIFTKSATSGDWDPSPGMYGKLKQQSGWYSLTLPEGSVMTLLPAGGGRQRVYPIAAYEDRFGNRSQYWYPQHGRLTTMADPLNRTLQMVYVPETGRLKSLGDFAGNDLQYTVYGGSDPDGFLGNLLSVEGPLYSNTLTGARERRKLSYGYYLATDDHRLKWTQDPAGNVGNLGNLLAMTYNGDGHVLTQDYGSGTFTTFKFTPGTNQNPAVLIMVDRKKQSWRWEFDLPGPSGFARQPTRHVVNVGGKDLTHAFVYNPQGELTEHTWPMGNKTVVTFTHDAPNPCDRINIVSVKSVPDAVRPAKVTRGSGVYDYTTDLVEMAFTAIEETYTHVTDLQMVETSTDPLARVAKRTFTNGFFMDETYPTVTQAGATASSQTIKRQMVWNRWGQILKHVDPNGVVTKYSYYPSDDPCGLGGKPPVSAEDAAGGLVAMVERDFADPTFTRAPHLDAVRTIKQQFKYDELGSLTEEIDGMSNSTMHTCNELGELVRLVGPELDETKYFYDANGRPAELRYSVADLDIPSEIPSQPLTIVREVQQFNRQGRLVLSIVDADGLALTTKYDYDDNDNLEYRRSPLSQRTANPQQFNRIRYFYDEADRRAKEISGEGSTITLIHEFVYDDNDALKRETYGTSKGRTIERDGIGRIIARADDMGGRVETQLDDVGNVARIMVKGSIDGDPTHLGTLQDQLYYRDEADRVIAIRERAFDLTPDPANPSNFVETPVGTGADAGRRVHQYAYDAAGRQIQVIEPTGLQTTISPDGHGLPVVVKDNQGGIGRTDYNGLNLAATIGGTDDLGSTSISRNYDNCGRPINETIDGILRQQVYYDTLGRPRLREDALGNRIEVQYDGAGRRSKTIHRLYAKGRRINDDGSENPLLQTLTSSVEFDENGNMRKANDFSSQVAEDLQYNDCNLVSTRTLPEDKFTYGGTVRDDNQGPESYAFTYRTDGLIDVITDPSGNIISHEYDDAGRAKRKTIVPPTGGTLYGTTEEQYTWDGASRLILAKDNNGFANNWSTVTQRFNSLGRVSYCSQKEDFTAVSVLAEITYNYSNDGRRLVMGYPSKARAIRTAPTIFGNTSSVTDDVTGKQYANYKYRGRVFSSRKYSNNLTYGVGYNDKKEMRELRTYTGDNFLDDTAMIAGNRYSYNALGMPETDWDLMKGQLTRNYYDSLYRLGATVYGFNPTQPVSTPAGGSWMYYDAQGNSTSTEAGAVVPDPAGTGKFAITVGVQTAAEYNQANQTGYKFITERAPGVMPASRTQIYQYDKRGNLFHDGTMEFHYDYKNRLVEIVPQVLSGFSTAPAPQHFYYDAFDRRIRKNDKLRYLWSEYDLLEEVPDAGGLTRRYIYGSQAGELIAYEATVAGSIDRTFFVHESRNGDIQFLTDLSGNIVEKYSSDSFAQPKVQDKDGNPQQPQNITGNPFIMHGQYFDSESGLYSVGPRMFHPFLGKFMQRDPGGALQDPMAYANPYTYAGNNPAAFSDKSGRQSELAAGAWEAGKALAVGVGTAVAIGALAWFLPILGAVAGLVMFGLFIYNYWSAIDQRLDERRFAGQTGIGSLGLSFAAAAGDMFGISSFVEACMGHRISSGLALNPMDRAKMAGHGLGQMASFVAGWFAFRGTRAGLNRVFGERTITVRLYMARTGGDSILRSIFRQGHMMLQYIDEEAGTITRIDRYLAGVTRKVYGEASLERLLEYDSDARSRYVEVAAYEVPRSAIRSAEAMLNNKTSSVRVAKGAILRTEYAQSTTRIGCYVPYIRGCCTVPGELGIGLYMPLTPGLTGLTHSAFYSGFFPGLAGSSMSSRSPWHMWE